MGCCHKVAIGDGRRRCHRAAATRVGNRRHWFTDRVCKLNPLPIIIIYRGEAVPFTRARTRKKNGTANTGVSAKSRRQTVVLLSVIGLGAGASRAIQWLKRSTVTDRVIKCGFKQLSKYLWDGSFARLLLPFRLVFVFPC